MRLPTSPEGCTRFVILGRRIKERKWLFSSLAQQLFPSFITVGSGFTPPARDHTPTIFIFLRPFVSFMSHIWQQPCPPPPVTKTQWLPSNTAEFQDTELNLSDELLDGTTTSTLSRGGGSLCWDDSRVRRPLFSIRTVEPLIGSHGAPPPPHIRASSANGGPPETTVLIV